MKKLSKLIALAMTIASVALFGCSNISSDSDSLVTQGAEHVVPRTDTIQLFAGADNGIIDFSSSSSARTIMPGVVDQSKILFYLLYKDNLSDTGFTAKQVTFSPAELTTPQYVLLTGTKPADWPTDATPSTVYFKNNDGTGDVTSADAYVSGNFYKKITSSSTEGSITESFKLSDYDFRLFAVENNSDNADGKLNATSLASDTDFVSKALFIGYANADLRYDSKVYFHLKANSSSGVLGKISLNVYHEEDTLSRCGWSTGGYSVSVTLNQLETDVQVAAYAGSGSLIAPAGAINTIGWTSSGAGYSISAKQITFDDVTPGEYNILFTYTKDTRSYVYSEKVIVLPLQTSEGTIVIPQILDKLPVTPENFTVQIKDPETTESKQYPAKFYWDDNANNEQEFILQIMAFKDDSVAPVFPQTDAEWSAGVTAGHTITTYTRLTAYNSERYISGSLNKLGNVGETGYLELYLDTQKRYAARITARNDLSANITPSIASGVSIADTTTEQTWAYVNWISTLSTADEAAKYITFDPIDTSDTTGDEYVSTINRFKISYDLNGGEFYGIISADKKKLTSGASATTPAKPATIHYASQKTNVKWTAAGAVDTQTASTTAYSIISPDGIMEQKWYTDLTGDTLIAAAAPIALIKDSAEDKYTGQYFDYWCVGDASDPQDPSADGGTPISTIPANGRWYPFTATYTTVADDIANAVKVKTERDPLIRYYPGTVTDDDTAAQYALASQPKDSSEIKDTYKVRTLKQAVYNGFKDLYLVAHYDTTKTFGVEIEDITKYELQRDWIKTEFQILGGATKLDSGDTVTPPGTFDDVEGTVEVSLKNCNTVNISIDADAAKFPVTTYNETSNTVTTAEGTYDTYHLKIRSINGNKTMFDEDSNTSKAWIASFRTWTPGTYEFEVTVTTKEYPGKVFAQNMVIYITQ